MHGEQGEDEEAVSAGARKGRWRMQLRAEHDAEGTASKRAYGGRHRRVERLQGLKENFFYF